MKLKLQRVHFESEWDLTFSEDELSMLVSALANYPLNATRQWDAERLTKNILQQVGYLDENQKVVDKDNEWSYDKWQEGIHGKYRRSSYNELSVAYFFKQKRWKELRERGEPDVLVVDRPVVGKEVIQ